MERDFKVLIGKILSGISINEYNDELIFTCQDGSKYKMYHCQDCCESVTIEDICGNLDNLIGVPILMAEESTKIGDNEQQSETWTFYKLATVKGYITIRWYGESNGYYSESVDFEEIEG